jgi:hypothetical protein
VCYHIGEEQRCEHLGDGADFKYGVAVERTSVRCAGLAVCNELAPRRMNKTSNDAYTLVGYLDTFLQDGADCLISQCLRSRP